VPSSLKVNRLQIKPATARNSPSASNAPASDGVTLGQRIKLCAMATAVSAGDDMTASLEVQILYRGKATTMKARRADGKHGMSHGRCDSTVRERK
jgi:hypothetical protein